MPLPVVAIIGRPNVGKSTLFNRLARQRQAITDDTPGVTRDRLYQKIEWAGRFFIAIDTGGFMPRSEEVFEQKVREQAEIAIGEADLVLFLTDAKVGPVDIDQDISRMLKKTGKPTILAVNKADNQTLEVQSSEFYNLGLGDPMPISAATGSGVGDMLDAVIAKIPEAVEEEDEETIGVAVVGRPNVGKSSIVNRILGNERLIVTDVAGTTRDSIDSRVEYKDEEFLLIDTAGLRRSAKVKNNLEFYTAIRTVRSIQRADVVMVLVEAPLGVTTNDLRIIEQVVEERKGILLVVNKWDLVEKDTHAVDHFTRAFYDRAKTMDFVPLVFVSAKTGQRATKTLDMVLKIYQERFKRISTPELNDFLKAVVAEKHPPAHRGQHIKFYYLTQSAVAPPTFVFFANYPEYLDRSYIRFLENRLRDKFGFVGNSIRMKFNKRKSRASA